MHPTPSIPRSHLNKISIITASLALLAAAPLARAATADADLEAGYRFLVSDRDTAGGILYTATAGSLRGRQLPLSFHDSPAYWGEYVCRLPGHECRVTDIYNPATFTLTPEPSPAGDLQTERVNTHNGANIYDAAAWQIAVMLGNVVNRFPLPGNQQAYALAGNQNHLLREGHNGDSSHRAAGENRAVTAGAVFVYNRQAISDAKRAYSYRMLPRNWLSTDPLTGTAYANLITARDLPPLNPGYRPGKVTWTDWKPITGENSWAFLLGPLQAASLHYLVELKSAFVPFTDPAVQNALAVLPAFAAMQSPLGAVYYAPAGTVVNQGDRLVNPFEVAVENNISLYAGLGILRATLEAELAHETHLGAMERSAIVEALRLSEAMISGGRIGNTRTTGGLLAFFKDWAWQQGEFVQGGQADDPSGPHRWVPNLRPKAVDVNTWGIAALGARQIDQWFGFGASYRNWQQVKRWGGYGVGTTLWGVGFSDADGNGIDGNGQYRQGILSAEWTAGAITMVRAMIRHYSSIPADAPHYAEARGFVETLRQDEHSMRSALTNLRLDAYANAPFPGKPEAYGRLLSLPTRPYLYASKRYLIPFGWYANPLPSTCATAWMIMVANEYNPFVPGGLNR